MRFAVSGSTVFAGGTFTTVHGSTARHGAAAFATGTGVANGWNPDFDGQVNGLVASAATVLAGGAFSKVGNLERSGLAEVDAFSGSPTTWDPVPNGAVDALVAASRGAVAGGSFTGFGDGATAQTGVAVLASLNRAIVATGATVNATVTRRFTGVVATFTLVYPGAAPGQFDAAVDWGDGTPSTTATVGSAGGPSP